MGIKSNLTRNISLYALGFALALPLQAGALDFTPDPSRVLTDPSYLPMQGQVYGSTEYSFQRTEWDTDDNLGVQTKSNTNTASVIDQELEYGVTNDFTLRLTDSYEWLKANVSEPFSPSTDTHSYGFTDPSFGATWRVLDQQRFPFSWDLIGDYAPNLIDAKSASTEEDGTVARGGWTGTLGTALSYKTRDFTMYGDALATYQGNRKTFNETTHDSVTYDSSWEYQLALNTQTRLTDLFSVNLGVTQTFNNNDDANQVTTSGHTLDFTYEPGDTTDFNVALNYQLIPNTLAGALIYVHSFYDNDTSSVYSTSTKSNTTLKNESTDTFGAKLYYAFN